MLITKVFMSRRAERDLLKAPRYIADKLAGWVESVRTDGLQIVRRIPGYHDEPLKGKRSDQRSIRLSRSYRAIYETKKDGKIEFVSIEEVTKHDY